MCLPYARICSSGKTKIHLLDENFHIGEMFSYELNTAIMRGIVNQYYFKYGIGLLKE